MYSNKNYFEVFLNICMEDFLGEITAIEKKYVAINKQKDFILI